MIIQTIEVPATLKLKRLDSIEQLLDVEGFCTLHKFDFELPPIECIAEDVLDFLRDREG